LLELLAVPGLRPEKVLRLYKDPGIVSLASWKPRPRTIASRRPKDWALLQTKILQTWPSQKPEKAAFTCIVPPLLLHTARIHSARPEPRA
jgi:DNA polymerase (family 10)